MAKTRRPRQLALVLPCTWGGKRAGAGRKPKGSAAEIAHARRAPLDARHPVHVTCRVVAGVPYLRSARAYRIVRDALCVAKERLGMRIVHFSVQEDHLHLLVEVEDEVALGRAMKGFQVRVARRLNRIFGRTGRVFADRYHSRYVSTPTEARRALVYVLQNGKKHAPTGERIVRGERSWVDPFSSCAYFDGWKRECRRFIPSRDAPAHPVHRDHPAAPVVAPRGWLLREGWRQAGGELDTHERPEERSSAAHPRAPRPPASMKRRTSSRSSRKPRRQA